MTYSAGTAYLTVVPSFLNIERAFRKEAENLGKQVDSAISDAVKNGMADGGKGAKVEGERAGNAYAGAFADSVRRRLEAALKAMPKVEINADSSTAEKAIAEIRADLETLRDAKIGVDLTEDEFFAEVARVQAAAEKLDHENITIEIRTNARAVAAELSALGQVGDSSNTASAQARQAREQGAAAGSQYAGAFEEAARRRLGSASEAIGKIPLDLDATGVEGELASIKARIDALKHADIDIDIPAEQWAGELAELEAALKTISESDVEINVKANTRAALAQIQALRASAGEVTEDPGLAARARQQAAEAGSQYGGAFDEAVRRRLSAASEAIGKVPLDLDTSTADGELTEIRRRIEALKHSDINIDIPASQWEAELLALETALRTVSETAVEIDVKTNARSALAEIQALRAAIGAGADPAEQGAEDGGAYATGLRNALRAALTALPEIHVDVDSSAADIQIARLREHLLTLSNAHIGVDIDAGEANAQIALIALELRALGAEDPRIDIHTNALAAAAELTAFQEVVRHLDGEDVNVNVGGNAAGEVAQIGETAGVSLSRLGALVSLGASLGTAIVPAAAAAAASIGAIATAASSAALGIGVFALGIFGPLKAVTALAAAHKQAGTAATSQAGAEDRVASALDSEKSAQQALHKAETERKQAVIDLAKAQEDARRQLEDASIAIRENALAQRQARLDEVAAKAALDKLNSNPRATADEREQAQITYQEKLLQIEDLGDKQKRMTADNAVAVKKGVAGSDLVVAAQQRIQDANDSLASAQRQVAASQRQLAQAYQKTGTAGGAAINNLAAAMNGLTPAGRRFALFIYGLRGDFKQLQGAAENGLLPGVQRSIETLLPFLPQLTTLVGKVAVAVGDGFAYFATQLKDPVFRKFFDYIAATAAPTIKGMFVFTTNVAKGIVGIINGLSGFNGSIGQGLLKWSEGFAKWGETLGTNKGWQKFLAYVRDAAPKVIGFFKNLWDFTTKFVAAAAPIGTFVVQALSALFGWMSKLDTGTWTIIIGAIAGIGLALLGVAAVTAIVAADTAALIAGIVVIVGAGLVLLYQKFTPFRVAVQATFNAIGVASKWLWVNVLKPVFGFIVAGVIVVKNIFVTWYNDVFVQLFSAIAGILSAWWSTVKTVFSALTPVFKFFGDYVKLVFGFWSAVIKVAASIFKWWYEHILKPIFVLIGIAFQVWKVIFEIAFGLFQIGVKLIAAAFHWFYDNAIAPVLKKLKPVFDYIANVIKNDVEPPFKKGLQKLGEAWDAFSDAGKKVIKFVIVTVLNEGLLAGYNKVAKFFDVKPDDVQINLPKGFKTGGGIDGPGTGTSDSVVIRASKGEHVWTDKEVRAAGGHDVMYAMRRAVLGGYRLPGYSVGGAIGSAAGDVGDFFSSAAGAVGDVFGGIKDFLSDPLKSLKDLAKKLFDSIPGKDTQLGQVVVGMPTKALQDLVNKVKSFIGLGSGSVGDAAKAVGQIAGRAGASPGFPSWPASPAASRGDSGVWRGIVSLIKSTGPISGKFGNAYRAGDPLWHGSGRAVDWMGFNQDALATWLTTRRPLELIHRSKTRDYAYTRGVNKGSFRESLMDEHRNHVHIAFDQGGMLQPGYTQVFNGTGVPEPVLTGQQWKDMNDAAHTGRNPAPGASYSFEFRDTTLDPGKLRAIQDREAALSRQGRAR